MEWPIGNFCKAHSCCTHALKVIKFGDEALCQACFIREMWFVDCSCTTGNVLSYGAFNEVRLSVQGHLLPEFEC